MIECKAILLCWAPDDPRFPTAPVIDIHSMLSHCAFHLLLWSLLLQTNRLVFFRCLFLDICGTERCENTEFVTEVD